MIQKEIRREGKSAENSDYCPLLFDFVKANITEWPQALQAVAGDTVKGMDMTQAGSCSVVGLRPLFAQSSEKNACAPSHCIFSQRATSPSDGPTRRLGEGVWDATEVTASRLILLRISECGRSQNVVDGQIPSLVS